MDRSAPRRTVLVALLTLLLGSLPTLGPDARGPLGGGGAVFAATDDAAGDGFAHPRGYALDGFAERQAASTPAFLGTAPSAPRATPPASARSVPFRTDAPARHLALLTNVRLLDGG